MYVILLWRVSSLISSSQFLELLTLYSYLMITGTFTCRFLNGLAFSILSSSSSVVSCIMWALLQAKEWAWLCLKPIIEIPEPPQGLAVWQAWVVPLPGSSNPTLPPLQRQRSHFLKEECVSPECSIIFALAPNALTFSSSKASMISL